MEKDDDDGSAFLVPTASFEDGSSAGVGATFFPLLLDEDSDQLQASPRLYKDSSHRVTTVSCFSMARPVAVSGTDKIDIHDPPGRQLMIQNTRKHHQTQIMVLSPRHSTQSLPV